MNTTDALILFARQPQLGKVKTRLAAEIGDAKALELYKRFLMDKETLFSRLVCEKMINYTPDTKAAAAYFYMQFDRNIAMWPQAGADLGERMRNAFLHGFHQGFERLLLVGSDSPQLSVGIVEQAFELLDKNDVVLGPSNDDGYYLVGFKKAAFTPTALQQIEWSTVRVLTQTLEALERSGRVVAFLTELTDCDTLDD